MSVDYIAMLINKGPDYLVGGAAFVTLLLKLKEMHLTMNSRLDQLITAARAEGRQTERDSHSVTVPGEPTPEKKKDDHA